MRLRLLLSLMRGRGRAGTILPGPVMTAAPSISGTAEVGQALSCSTGTWTGNGTISYAYQWRRNGAEISIATSNSYTLQAADDGATITCTVSATDLDGTRAATASGADVTYPAPSASGALSDQSYTLDTGDKAVDASTDFSGATGGSWGVSGGGASIDSSGVVTIPTDVALTGAVITVTYTNSGGQASSAFQVDVSEAVPASGSFSSAFSGAFDVAA